MRATLSHKGRGEVSAIAANNVSNGAPMSQPPSATDAHLWIRHDAARWLKPGTDPAVVFPALKRQRDMASCP
jgi:hypothetical protein